MTPEAPRRAARLGVAALVLWIAAALVYGVFTMAYGDRPAYVHVRWAASVDDAARQRFEEQYRLTRGQVREGQTWGYFVADVSRANLRALVQNPQVEDTHQINRQRFTIWRTADRDPYTGPFASWLPIVLQVVALFLLVVGAIPAGIAVLELVGAPASVREPLEPFAAAFAQPPPIRLGPLAAVGRWLAARVPAASAESVAAFRIVFGAALVALVLLKPVGSEWITAGAANPVTALQDLVLRVVFARPAVADWLAVWVAVCGALFVAGAFARTSYVLLALGVLSWACVYTMRIGAHPISALMLTLPCLVWSRWGDAWSVDAWRRRTTPAPVRAPQEYGYTIWMPGVVLGVTLAAAAVSKLRDGFGWILNGTVKYHFLTDSRDALVDWGLSIGPHPTLAVIVSLGAVATEALVIVGAASRTYAWRALAGLAAMALLTGFALFQGLFWPAWWILLLSFLPWHRVRAASPLPLAVAARPLTPLRLVQVTMVIAVVVQQVAVSWPHAEINPLFSAYDMYSTTYGSPEEYEEKAAKTYWLVGRLEDGSTRSCAVGRDDAEQVAEAGGGEQQAQARRLAETCFGSAAVQSATVETRGTAIDRERWRLAGEKRVAIAGPIQMR